MFYGLGANGKQCHGNMSAAAVFFKRTWVLGLEKYDELEEIGWEWQSVDGCMIKAPLAREAVGHNPTDRGKNGDKTQLLIVITVENREMI